MSYRIALNQQGKQTQSLKQMQRLLMSPQMQQALKLLQVPILELAQMVEVEMEKNPILEYSEDHDSDNQGLTDLEAAETEAVTEKDVDPGQEVTFDDSNFEALRQLDDEFREYLSEAGSIHSKRTSEEDKLKSFLESSIHSKKSLFEHLTDQAKGVFDNNEDIIAAEVIIGSIDSKGFFSTPLSEIALLNNIPEKKLEDVLATIQTFDPPGIAAPTLRDSLLIQLKLLNKQNTLAYQVIENYFEDLLHNRMVHIAKKLNVTPKEVSDAIAKEILHLSFNPGTTFSDELVQQITPDVIIDQDEDKLFIVINNEYIPNIKINYKYVRMCQDPNLSDETRDFIKQKVVSAKWLMKNIYQRNSTLERIATLISEEQSDFFLKPTGELNPMTMKYVAQALDLHESTIARAVANKYLSCDRGTFPLRHFFTNAYISEKGEDISSETVRNQLENLISQEDKKRPLSDSLLSKLLKEKGIDCARRTVAKYRSELHIGNTQQRREYH